MCLVMQLLPPYSYKVSDTVLTATAVVPFPCLHDNRRENRNIIKVDYKTVHVIYRIDEECVASLGMLERF